MHCAATVRSDWVADLDEASRSLDSVCLESILWSLQPKCKEKSFCRFERFFWTRLFTSLISVKFDSPFCDKRIHRVLKLCGKQLEFGNEVPYLNTPWRTFKKTKKGRKSLKKGVDKWEWVWYYNQALKRAATSEAKQGPWWGSVRLNRKRSQALCKLNNTI